MTGANFDLNYLSYFWMHFQNSCAYHVANFLNFSKPFQLLQFGWEKPTKKQEQSGNSIVGTM